MPEPIILPTTFNVDNSVVEPDIIALFNILQVVELTSIFCVLVGPILNAILPYSCKVKVSDVWSNWI